MAVRYNRCRRPLEWHRYGRQRRRRRGRGHSLARTAQAPVCGRQNVWRMCPCNPGARRPTGVSCAAEASELRQRLGGSRVTGAPCRRPRSEDGLRLGIGWWRSRSPSVGAHTGGRREAEPRDHPSTCGTLALARWSVPDPSRPLVRLTMERFGDPQARAGQSRPIQSRVRRSGGARPVSKRGSACDVRPAGSTSHGTTSKM